MALESKNNNQEKHRKTDRQKRSKTPHMMCVCGFFFSG